MDFLDILHSKCFYLALTVLVSLHEIVSAPSKMLAHNGSHQLRAPWMTV